MMKLQLPRDALDISLWISDADYGGVFPKGAREKSLYNSPDDVSEWSYLKPDFKYLFKESFHRYPDQFWAEIIAYKVGHCVGVTVPPAFVAYRVEEGAVICGALIEWFYDDKSPFFLTCYDGGDLLGEIIPDFDHKKGTKHNFLDIIQLFKKIDNLENYSIDKGWATDWVKFLVFDTLIGNTDRHQNNWGIIIHIVDDGKYSAEMAPAFDNGTSLGHEILECNFVNFQQELNLERYVNRGKHHMRLRVGGERLGHFEAIDSILSLIPNSHNVVENMLNFDFLHIEDDILNLTEFDIQIPLSKDRCEFVLMLLHKRIEKVRNLLDKYKS